MEDEITFETNYGEKKNNSIIKVIGIGGAGNNAVQHMYKDGIVGVDFLVCNTDRMAVERNEVPMKLVFGDSGLGAGANPKEAERLAIESEQKIRDFIGTETRMLFLTAGMGKGTGTGASPVVAKIAREMGILTIAVVTYPYELEGKQSYNKADKGIAELKKYVDSLIVVQNQKILDEYENETLRVALGYADDVLKNAVKCIAELITLEGYQNVDFNDVLTIMRESGEAMLGLAEASGEDRIEKVVAGALTCPLIDDLNISNAQNFLFFVRYGEGRELTVAELKKLSKEFDKFRSAETNVIWGHAADKDLGDKIKLSVIITNYSHKNTPDGSNDNGNELDSFFNNQGLKTESPIEPIQARNEPIEIQIPAAPTATATPNEPTNTIEFDVNNNIPVSEPRQDTNISDIFNTPQQPTNIVENTSMPTAQQQNDPFDFLAPSAPVAIVEQPRQVVATQPVLAQPIAQPAPQPAFPTAQSQPVITRYENGSTSQVTMVEDPNDRIYENESEFQRLLKEPAYQRRQPDHSTLAQERAERMVTPAKVLPQASYTNNLFFGVIPTVD